MLKVIGIGFGVIFLFSLLMTIFDAKIQAWLNKKDETILPPGGEGQKEPGDS